VLSDHLEVLNIRDASLHASICNRPQE